jgi:hypothetical protein
MLPWEQEENKMKFSVDVRVRRVSAESCVNPETSTINPTIEEVIKIIELLFHIEGALGEVAKWIEVIQVRFQQHELGREWVAHLTAILKEPDSSERKLNPINWYFSPREISSEEAFRYAIATIRRELRVNQCALERSADAIGNAISTIKSSI